MDNSRHFSLFSFLHFGSDRIGGGAVSCMHDKLAPLLSSCHPAIIHAPDHHVVASGVLMPFYFIN